jgi:hypothetical protein
MLAMASAAMASAYVAAPIARLVSFEMIKGLVSVLRNGTFVAVMRIETVINVALEFVGAVEPGAGSDEHAAVEPLGAVVAVWRAVVRGGIVVAIRASRFCSNTDRDLRGWRAGNVQKSCKQGSKGKKCQRTHEFLLALEGSNPDAKIVMIGRD